MHIMIIEDDPGIRNALAELLEHYGYTITAPSVFTDCTGQILKAQPDLLLLDINLPVSDGFMICREIRAISDLPIIVVTSRDSEIDELMSMNLGADDFITKPFNTQILLAHIAAVLKRNTRISPVLTCGSLRLDLAGSTLDTGTQTIVLTKNESRILSLLMGRPGTIVSRESLMTALWESDAFVDDNTLTVNINRLRKKLAAAGISDFLVTRRGQGYMVMP